MVSRDHLVIAGLLIRYAWMPIFAERYFVRRGRDRFHKSPDYTHKISDRKCIWVDVSVIARHDPRTGIQRVVRAISNHLNFRRTDEMNVRFVAATKTGEFREVNWSSDGIKSEGARSISDLIAPGDIFLGLDLAAHIIPRKKDILGAWKSKGVKLYFFVYDLLPLRHPEWFSWRLARAFRRWVRAVFILADGVFCISKAVESDFNDWAYNALRLKSEELPTYLVPMGADLDNSLPSFGLPEDYADLLGRFQLADRVFLSVGTVEPRKGQAQLLSAFECLWRKGINYTLVIVGKPGWKTVALQCAIERHAEFGKRLFWFKDASDEFLNKLYLLCNGLILPSVAEGFGLPVIEALRCQKPVLLRDIPVFREFNSPLVSYFTGSHGLQLAEAIAHWDFDIEIAALAKDERYSLSTWDDCALNIISVVM